MSGSVDGRRVVGVVVGHHDRHDEIRAARRCHIHATGGRPCFTVERPRPSCARRLDDGQCGECVVVQYQKFILSPNCFDEHHSGTGVSDDGLTSCLLAALESLNDVRNGLGSMTRAMCQWVRVPAIGGRTHLPATLQFGTKPQRPRAACSRFHIYILITVRVLSHLTSFRVL